MVNPHRKSRCDLCMFEMETRKNILERLKQYYTETAGDKVNLVEGGFAWDTLSANAKEFEKAYAEMALLKPLFRKQVGVIGSQKKLKNMVLYDKKPQILVLF